MIAMQVSDRPGEAVQNRTSLSIHSGLVDSTVVQPTGCLKGLPARRLSNSLPIDGTLAALPSWSVARSGPLWHYKALGLGRLRTKPVGWLVLLAQEV